MRSHLPFHLLPSFMSVIPLLTLAIAFSTSHGERCLDDQRAILLQLHQDILNQSSNSTVPFSSPKVQLWDMRETDCCFWEGVRCDEGGRIVELDLSYSNISGGIKSIFGLRHLQGLDLAGNDFQQSLIPSGFPNLGDLTHLNLSWSYFSGQVPLEISHLAKLVSLDLSHNFDLKLERPKLETFIRNFTSLEELHLDWVNLSAQGPNWGEALAGALPNLRALSLFDCGLSGPIHPSLSGLRFLSLLRLEGNNFSATAVPNFLANFSHLTTLSLAYCELQGEFPTDVFLLPHLKAIDLSGNENLTVRIPKIPKNNTLEVLSISNTKFYGGLLHFINNLEFLDSFRASGCNLSGSIPLLFSKLSCLSTLLIARNNFSGTIMLDIFLQNHKSLVYVNLSGNSLSVESNTSGFITPQLKVLRLSSCNLTEFPEFLRNQASLQYLDLSNNRIQGYVPSWIWKSPNLFLLNLSYNAVDILEPISSAQNNDTPILNENGNSSSLNLETLYLGSCNISRFPDFLGRQNGLEYLDLSENKLHGQTPNWIWKESLYYLNLSHNYLSSLGKLSSPNISLNSLETLDIRANYLQGSFPATVLCNSTELYFLDLSHNHFSGLIPECLGKLDALEVLNLKGNHFHGEIPSNFSLAKSLRSLVMNGNQLQGKPPTSLADCTNLEILDLGNNKISGTFPFWLGKLPALKVLVLRNNSFNGPIELPPINCSFSSLHILDLSYNEFRGALSAKFLHCLKGMLTTKNENTAELQYIEPGGYGVSIAVSNKGLEMEMIHIIVSFASLDLSNNWLRGKLPEEIGSLKSLHALNLSWNGFSGHIPPSIGNLTHLESLDLSQNRLSGRIPSVLTSLTTLEVFHVSYNQLEGSISQVNQFGTFPAESYEGNANLCDLPLSRKCSKATPVPASPDGERLEGTSRFQWKYIWMGYGSGLVIGASIGYILLHNIEDDRFLNFVTSLRCNGKNRMKSRHSRHRLQLLRR